MAGTHIYSIAHLKNCEIQHLDISRTKVHAMETEIYKKLRVLKADNSKFMNLGEIPEDNVLEVIHLKGVDLENPEELKKLKKLKTIHCDKKHVGKYKKALGNRAKSVQFRF